MNTLEIIKELQFKATRSSGAGGQHVNKVSSKIELTFDLENSLVLSDKEKTLLKEKLTSKLTNENVLILFCDDTRSQHRNKEIVIKRFLKTIKKGLQKPKVRKATKPSFSSLKRKAESKQRNSLKKALRKKPKID